MAAARKDRILIIDDSKSLRQEIREVLDKAGIDADFYEAGNGLEGFKILLDHPVDLVFCDLVMPQIDGTKFLQMRASRPYLLEIPVLMLTAIGDVDQKIKVLSQGANDYITKPFHPGELVARANVHLKIKHLQDELRQKNALLVELSTTDSLTKIYNRRHFLELARKEFERSSRMGLQLTMLILDVDHFKTINDTYGHQAGDEVLLAVCKVVDNSLRDYDIFGRYGGDEFTIIFPQTELIQSMKVAERLEKSVQELKMECVNNHKLSLSGGLAAKTANHKDLESLIKDADEALYRAKQTGRARIVAF
ncbi:MAG TPA: diguanylate cyclase [Acidobacteriota bacterium]|nr:diguanylate cyclase [Acidobacteriota bacterium]HNT17284.1 diguanylate cyclase [Acidobacteriota bacterium]HPA26347.1 diguanylate cyclase [Acidobacteriota bacterium]HQO19757.1 diguanylate cyclase [Acidobacteriota bacterium]HQQ46329.1 diguanylate cyclase [Acidobacteriota bacterium]